MEADLNTKVVEISIREFRVREHGPIDVMFGLTMDKDSDGGV